MKVSILGASGPQFDVAWWKPTYVGYEQRPDGRCRAVFFGNRIGTSWESTDKAHAAMVPASEYPFGDRVVAYIDGSTAEVVS